MSASRGQFLVGAIAFMAFLLIVIQAMVYFSKHETKWTVKEQQSTTAFYLAETAVNRAVWKLKETDTAFQDVLSNGVPAGYAHDVVYEDVPGGAYRVLMTTTGANQITVLGTGKDTAANEYRAVQVVLEGGGGGGGPTAEGAIYAGAVNLSAGFRIYWGPIYATGNLGLDTASNQLWPRKYTRGNIVVNGGIAYVRDANGATAPNTDSLEWWTYQDTSVVPDPPAVDLDQYKTLAQAETGCPAGGTPAGSCYYSGAINWNAYKNTTEKTYYFDGNAQFRNATHLRGTIIAMGSEIFFDGTGADPEGTYAVVPPADAWMDFRKNTPQVFPLTDCGSGGGVGAADDGNYANGAAAEGDKACRDQYPGDVGLNLPESFNFKNGCASHSGNSGGSTLVPVSFKGFLYVKNLLRGDASTWNTVHGKVQLETGATTTGNLQIFYDPDVDPIVTGGGGGGGGSGFSQTSWQEVVATPF